MSCSLADAAVPLANLTSEISLGSAVQYLSLEDNAALWKVLPCHDQPLADAAIRFPNRNTWRDPTADSICCRTHASTCFRAVLDGRIILPPRQFSVGQKVRARNYAAKRPPNAPGWVLGRVTSTDPLRVRDTTTQSRRGRPWDEVRPWEQRDDDDDVAVVEAVRRLLLSEVEGLRDDEVVATTWRRQAMAFKPDFLDANAFHFDYAQSAGALWSATVYTGHDGDGPLVGGWTAFVDAEGNPPAKTEPGLHRSPNGSAVLHRGLAIAPRIGRLVLFSGGRENYHAPLPVGQGRRQSLQIFFGCRCGGERAGARRGADEL